MQQLSQYRVLLPALIPAMPLVAAVFTAIFGRTLLKDRCHTPVIVALVASFVFSVLLLSDVHKQSQAAPGIGWERTVNLWTWEFIDEAIETAKVPKAALQNYPLAESLLDPAEKLAAPDTPERLALPPALPFKIEVTLRSDPLTAIMLAMVTFVSSLVAIYASGYMHGDKGYWRFFSYIGLFVFSMTMLVSVSNFALLYLFWEAVGVCSYLLIGFWFEKPEAAAAGKKAFLVNRVGDFGFAIALFLIWVTYGTLNFHDSEAVAGVLGQTRLADPSLFATGGAATAICLLLMLGACGKSAQFPLHTWLPDAMEGPTPVSALIHAATMVTAGVYMVTRCAPLFAQSVDAQHAVAIIGTTTAVIGGIIAMTQTDLKRVLAYSTISQLGYMFLGLGVATVAGITAGMFHLFTHAFFKALLFLGAGSVMHAMGGVIDMRRFGGLRKLMPTTHWTFLFGCLALAGVVPFSGFFSKDAILAAAYEQQSVDPLYGALFWVGLGTAFLTSIYTFRALFLTFYGSERVPYEAGEHAHESPPVMTLPLVFLAICALCVGGLCVWRFDFAGFLQRTPSLAYRLSPDAAEHAAHAGDAHTLVAAMSTAAALLGIGIAAFLYLGDSAHVNLAARILSPLYMLSKKKLFFDEIYDFAIVRPLAQLARLSALFDGRVIDGLVNLVGRIPPALGASMRSLQAGMVQFYALAMIWGIVVLIVTMLILPALGSVWK